MPKIPWCRNAFVVRRQAITKFTLPGLAANVSIVEQVATTVLRVDLKNKAASQQTAELLIPVPPGAVIKDLAFDGNASESKTELLEKHRAKSTFDKIVAKLRDPAMLEFAGYHLIRTSVFPGPGRGRAGR